MKIKEILANLDALKRALAIFKTEWSAEQRVQIAILEMMKAKRRIDTGKIRAWLRHHHTDTRLQLIEEVYKKWMQEIDQHNRDLFKNQKKLFG